MAIDIDSLLASVDLVAVVETRVDLEKRGSNWFGLCPFHGESTPSFTVAPQKGFYHCMGCGAHGDALDFLMQLDSLTLPQAAQALGHLEIKPREQLNGTPQGEWQSSKPPAGKPPPALWLRGLGEPVKTWLYNDFDGGLLGLVARYEQPGEKKQIRCWTWGHAGDEALHWAVRHWTRLRPLYGMDRLKARPDAQVVIVEGEKTCDAATALFPCSVCISWPGGVGGIRHADWRPLSGRRAVLIPDADRQPGSEYAAQPGPAAMHWLQQHLYQFQCDARLIDVGIDPDRTDGWDMADALTDGWTADRAVQWAREHIVREAPAVEQQPANKPARAKLYVVDGNTVRTVASVAKEQRQAQEKADRQQAAAELSELSLADQFVAKHAEEWRYVKASDSWIGWGDDGWRVDEIGRAKLAASEVTREVSEQSEHATASLRRKVCSAGAASAILTLAGVSERMAASINQWDTNTMLLGVPGGVIDLRDGSMRPAQRDDYITKRCAAVPERGEPALWLGHLRRVLRDDTELIGFIHRFLGYMLTGEVGEHAMVFLYGTGANGKGTVIETVIKLMGDYGYSAPVNLLMESKNERHPVELAMLRGKRGVSCSEPSQGARWDDGRIKWLTGGDTVTARGMGENLRSFPPTHKLLVMGNHKPSLRSVDEAIKRRFCIIDFGLTIPLEERDTQFPAKLRDEWPRILNWMIDGAMLWQEDGLVRPASLARATEAYLQDEDLIEQWMDECCERAGISAVAELYKSYCGWCEVNGERVWSKKAFSGAIYEKPGIGRKATAAARMVDGLRLRMQPQGEFRD